MHKKKFISFLLLLMLVLGGSLIMNKAIVDHLFNKESKLPVEIKWIAIGDSHICDAVNPDGYPWLVNRAHSGERMLYSFEKIKYYVENNPQIELVILGYWIESLNYNKDWVLHGKDVKYRYESYLPLMLFNNTNVDYLNVSKNRKLFLENYWGYKIGYPSPSVRLMVKNYFTFNQNLEMRGGFLKSKLKYIPKKSDKKKDKSTLVIDSLAMNNFKNIANYLKQKKIKLILYNTPVTSEFFEPFNDSNIKMIDNLASSFADNTNVWYINFSKYDVPNKYFGNLHHLNIHGANYMTPILIDSIMNLTTIKNSSAQKSFVKQ